MNKTKIEWVKNPDGSQGSTWNPITGCLNGCEYCYARKLANTRLFTTYQNNQNVAVDRSDLAEYEKAINDPFYPRFWPERLKSREQGFGDYMSGAFPKGIFVCDMSDLFGIGIPEEWTRRVLENIGQPWYKEHRFYLLTKQPQNLIKFSPFPDNCWVGVTATTNGNMSRALVNLAIIKAKVRYISLEPLEGRIGMSDHMSMKGIVDWVIIGAQTKPYKPPRVEWVQEIALACTKAHIPLFLKDNLRPLLPNRMPFWCPVSWREMDHTNTPITMSENRLRQEMPNSAQ